jgi:hypothetical protein
MGIEQVVYQLGLGNLVSKHKRPLREYREITCALSFGIPLFLLGLFTIIGSFVRGFDSSSIFVIFFCMTPSTMLIGLALLSFMIHRKDVQFLYEQGLVESYKGKIRGLRYDNITEVYQKYVDTKYQGKNIFSTAFLLFLAILSPTIIIDAGVPSYSYRFLSKNGTVITSNFDKVGNFVKEKSFLYLLPQMAKIYHSGGDIQFGFFTLCPQGLRTPSKKILYWSELWEINKETNSTGVYVSINLNQKRQNWVSISKISNFDIFWKLVMHLHKTHGKLQLENL